MKRLWLLLLPAGAGLVLLVSMSVFPALILISMLLLPILLGFSVQAVALFFAQRAGKWLRFASLGLLLIPIVGAVCEASVKGKLWQFAVMLWLAAAVLYLLGWGAAWALEAKDHA